MAITTHEARGELAYPAPPRQPYESRDLAIIGAAIAAGAA